MSLKNRTDYGHHFRHIGSLSAPKVHAKVKHRIMDSHVRVRHHIFFPYSVPRTSLPYSLSFRAPEFPALAHRHVSSNVFGYHDGLGSYLINSRLNGSVCVLVVCWE